MKKETKHYIDVDVVKQIMKEKNIDEKKLAECMKITLPTVKRFLSGSNQANITVLTIFRIARALEVSIPIILHKDYH